MNPFKISTRYVYWWIFGLFFMVWTCISGGQIYAQNTSEQALEEIEPIVLTGGRGKAIEASMLPDPSFIGVYLMVGKDFPSPVEEIIPWMQTFFTYYDLPVKFVKQKTPFDTKSCLITIFVNGTWIKGDLSTGFFSMIYVRDSHQKLFHRLRKLYDEANALQN